MAKVAVSIPDELLQSMDEYAKTNYLSRSGFISMCCHQFLQAQELQRVIGAMSDSMAKMADAAEAGSIDEATMQEFEQFQKLVKVITTAQLKRA